MVGPTPAKSKAERERLAAVSSLPCLPCLIDGFPAVPATVQHVVEARKRLGDFFSYPSCPWHHQAGMSGNVDKLTARYGPSLALDRREFATRYGSERQLVAITDALIRMRESSLKRGEFLTQRELVKIAGELHAEIVLWISP
jgi:hypothetical protein